MSYIFYVILSVSIIAIPGPGIMLTIATALQHEWRNVFINIFGLMSGLVVLAAAALVGLGVVVKTGSVVLMAVQSLGVAYLLYIGFSKVKSSRKMKVGGGVPQGGSFRVFSDGFLLSLFGAKPLIFFSSVIPQFIEPGGEYFPQAAALLSIFVGLVFLIHMVYASFARLVKKKLESNPSFFAEVERVSGWLFIAISLLLAWNLFS